MSSYATSNFAPHFSVILFTTIITVVVLGFARGFCYKARIKNRILQGLIGLAEAILACGVVIVVFLHEHYLGLVQGIINFLAPGNPKDSPAWAVLIACVIIAASGGIAGIGYNTIKRWAYKLRRKMAAKEAASKDAEM